MSTTLTTSSTTTSHSTSPLSSTASAPAAPATPRPAPLGAPPPAETVTVVGDTVVLSGAFDARSTATARDAIYGLLAEHDRVVVDLADVDGVDLTALRVLAAASHAATRSGHQVVLRGCGPAVRRLLHVSRLIRAVEVERAAIGA